MSKLSELIGICRSHRVGVRRKPANNNNNVKPPPRPILIKFTNYNIRRRVFLAKRHLKGTKFTIREDLTKKNRQTLTKAAGKYGVKNLWTLDGRIYDTQLDGRKCQYNPFEEDGRSFFSQVD